MSNIDLDDVRKDAFVALIAFGVMATFAVCVGQIASCKAKTDQAYEARKTIEALPKVEACHDTIVDLRMTREGPTHTFNCTSGATAEVRGDILFCRCKQSEEKKESE